MQRYFLNVRVLRFGILLIWAGILGGGSAGLCRADEILKREIAERVIQESVSTEAGKPSALYLLVRPRKIDPQKSYALLIYLHELGSSAYQVLENHYALFSQKDYYVLIPQAPEACGAGFSWYHLADRKQLLKDFERDEHMVLAMVAKMRIAYRIEPGKIYLSGFSQGGRLCFYIGFRNPSVFTEIMPICGFYMSDLFDRYLNQTGRLKIHLFHGTYDDVNPFAAMEKAYRKLKNTGMPIVMTAYPLGHAYNASVFAQMLEEIN